jgi:2-polyprenyl-3-methyl-5-hydroxy-6-metoxy-1,4-benzoquinol methylase
LASSYPLSEAILAELGEQAPFLLQATEKAPSFPLAERLPVLEQIARRLDTIFPPGWIGGAVRSYVVLSHEFQRLQRKLEQTGRYLLSSEREAYEQVYSRSDVLGGYYLPGLLLTQGLWPNHFGLAKSFDESFIPAIAPGARVLEVGVGTGFHLRALIERGPAFSYHGVDISAFPIDFAKKYALGDGTTADASFYLQNATGGLPFAPATFDAVICGEVLEHVERPGDLLRDIARVCKPGIPFFMTTAIYAASIDHIYLFENAAAVRDLVCESGWTIERDWVFPVYATDPEEARKPASIGCLLRSNLT